MHEVFEFIDYWDVHRHDLPYETDGVVIKVNDFAQEFKSEFSPEDVEDVDTIGGLIAKQLGRVPIPGSTISVPGWKLTAERPAGRRHRIVTVLAERITQVSEGSDHL